MTGCCDHCGKLLYEYEEDTIAWCSECVSLDWELLVLYQAVQPEEKYNQDYAWGKDSIAAEKIRQIPKRTLKNLPTTHEEICIAPIEVKCTDVRILPCKRLYYGIDCSCFDCTVQKLIVDGQVSSKPFCNKSYYGIDCNCSSCQG